MEFVIKNIILYDAFGNVSGFAEFKIRGDRTNIRVRYNDGDSEVLLFSIVANGAPARVFEISGVQSFCEFREFIDAEKEIFICISRREGSEIKTLASGVVNQAKLDKQKQAVSEISGNEIITDNEITDNTAEAAQVSAPKQPDQVSDLVAVRELDEALRKICIIDENGRGQCENCPYREHFFGAAVNADDDVVV